MPPFDENARGDTWNVSPDKWKVLDKTLLSREARHISRYLPMPSFHVWRCCMAITASVQQMASKDVLLTVEDVAQRLNVPRDRIWRHLSRRAAYLPVIRMSNGVFRHHSSEVCH